METLSYILVLLAIIIIVSLIMVYRKISDLRDTQLKDTDSKAFEMLNQNMQGLQGRLDKTTESLNERLDNAAKIIGAVNRELGSMSEIGRSIKDFQALLTSPKLRGNLGEQILYDTLSQTLPSSHYETQYKFKEGQTVDAVVRTTNGIICIDAKFPMENFIQMSKATTDSDRSIKLKDFVRQVKKHIDDIQRKYILPAEGTLEYAVMYVPSEKVFYEIVMDSEELLQYSHDRNILLVSPNTFLYYLRTVLIGLERAKIEEETGRIIELLKTIQNENVKFGEGLALVNRHMTNAKNALDSTNNQYDRFSNKIDQVKLLGGVKVKKDLTDSV
ncbi:MAG: DNA recombination protein RmuC [Candidatus Uhrbacteria bacterium]